MHYVSAETSIGAARQQIWDFIKPPENSVLLDPRVVRGFPAPGHEGVGEVRVFISVHDGVEHVSALEDVHEIPGELAITRSFGAMDPAARGRDFLKVTDDGGTIPEHGLHFTLPGDSDQFQYYERHRGYCQQYVERVKSLMERIQANKPEPSSDSGITPSET
ncbi:hypothetical protein GCM10023346_47790 [Arthrobacter gyeryongensis]|uniref:Polyketide cyclase / dehydrase and lipid transport n=1 Tax=Arthrobacter gyeryongensis TaxID=1650592 RepID=A0ABP9SWJ4_9MICC